MARNCTDYNYLPPETAYRNFQYDGRTLWGSSSAAWNNIAVAKAWQNTLAPGNSGTIPLSAPASYIIYITEKLLSLFIFYYN